MTQLRSTCVQLGCIRLHRLALRLSSRGFGTDHNVSFNLNLIRFPNKVHGIKRIQRGRLHYLADKYTKNRRKNMFLTTNEAFPHISSWIFFRKIQMNSVSIEALNPPSLFHVKWASIERLLWWKQMLLFNYILTRRYNVIGIELFKKYT